jgi:hypothetical protein
MRDSKEITNIRKQTCQTNGKTDGMVTRKILNDTMTNEHPKYETKNEDGYTRNYWKNLKKYMRRALKTYIVVGPDSHWSIGISIIQI